MCLPRLYFIFLLFILVACNPLGNEKQNPASKDTSNPKEQLELELEKTRKHIDSLSKPRKKTNSNQKDSLKPKVALLNE